VMIPPTPTADVTTSVRIRKDRLTG